MVRYGMVKAGGAPLLAVRFFRQDAYGSEPVRRWLQGLPSREKKSIGGDIRAVQFGWPLGLPLVDHLKGDIWEVRTKLENRIARVLFTVEGNAMVLLHGFIKKDEKTPKPDLELAQDRLRRTRGHK
jgi:phage-related protein